jgi:hypothetical protein
MSSEVNTDEKKRDVVLLQRGHVISSRTPVFGAAASDRRARSTVGRRPMSKEERRLYVVWRPYTITSVLEGEPALKGQGWTTTVNGHLKVEKPHLWM